MTTQTKQRYYYLDYLRILATLAVIFNHVTTTRWSDIPIETFDWKVLNFYNGFTRFPIGLFVMITGCTFGDPKKNITLKKLYTKSIFHMVTTFIFWSLFLVLFYPVLSSLLFGTAVDWENMVTNLVLGPYHMWFIYMIIGIYMIVPFLRKITENEALSKYYIVLGFLFAIVIPGIQDVLGESLLDGVLFKMAVSLPLGYSVFFVLGYYLHSHDIKGKSEALIYTLGVVSVFLTLSTSYLVTYQINEAYGYYGNFSIFLFFTNIALFVFAKNHLSRIKLSDNASKLLVSVSNNSFGVYLIHYFVFTILMRFGFSPTMIHPIIGVPLCAFAIYGVGYLVSLFLHRIPVLKNTIV